MKENISQIRVKRAKKRFNDWANKIVEFDTDSDKYIHAVYNDPYISKKDLMRIISEWCNEESLSCINFMMSDLIGNTPIDTGDYTINGINIVWIPVKYWKYLDCLRDLAFRKLELGNVLFIPFDVCFWDNPNRMQHIYTTVLDTYIHIPIVDLGSVLKAIQHTPFLDTQVIYHKTRLMERLSNSFKKKLKR